MANSYRITITTDLNTGGLKSGQNQANGIFDRIARDAEAAGKRVEKAFGKAFESINRVSGTGSRGGGGRSWLRDQTRAIEEMNRAEERARRASQNESTRTNRQKEREAQRAAREVQRINEQTRRDGERNARLLERTETQLANHRIREAQRAARAQARSFDQSIRQQQQASASGGGGGGLIAGALGGGLIGGAVGAAVGALVGLISDLTSHLREGATAWIEYASKIQNARIAFTTMLGGVVDADKHLHDLQQFALETPFAFDELVDASQRMQALGFEAKEVVPLLRDVGNAVAAVGGGNERLERVIKALSDVRAKGKLQAQEVRQFAEAGISAYAILREATGKTTTELQKMGEAGEISSELFISAFRQFSQLHFGDLMEQQAKTFSGAMSNIRDVLLQTAAKAFEPLFKKISEIAFRVQQELQKAKDLDQVVAVLGDAFLELGGYIGEKLLEGIASRLTSPSFWLKLVLLPAKSIYALLRGFGQSLRETLYNALTGKEYGELSSYDMLKQEEARLAKQKQVAPVASENTAKIIEQAKAQELAAKAAKDEVEIFDELFNKLSDISRASEYAATKQALLRAGVTDLTSGYAALALQMAATADANRAAQERIDIETTRVKERNAGFRSQLEQTTDSAMLQLAELQAAERGGLTEIEKFNLTLGSQIEGIINAAKETGNLTEELTSLKAQVDLVRKALEGVDQLNADQKAKAESERILKLRVDARRALMDLQRGVDRELRGTESTELERVADTIENISTFKMDPGALDPLLRLLREAPSESGRAIEKIQQILSVVRGELGPEFDAITQRILNALQAAGKLDEQTRQASSPVAREMKSLQRDLEQSQQAVAVAAETASLRYQIAWQDAMNDVLLSDDRAREEMVASQVYIADQTIFHADRARARVLEYFSRQRGVTEIWAEGFISAVDTAGDAIERAIGKITDKFGAFGDIIKGILSDLARLTLNRVFGRLLDILLPATSSGGRGGAAGAGGPSGGGGFLNAISGIGSTVLGGVFRPAGGGGGGTGFPFTGGFAGGPGAGAFVNPFTNILRGGGAVAGITGPASAQAAALANIFGTGAGIATPQSFLTSQLATQTITGAASSATATAAAKAATAGLPLGSFGASLAPMLPLLGLSLGAGLTPGSRLSSILGGAGGLLLGGAGAVGLLGGAGASIFASGGALAGLGGAAALLTNPFTIAAGVALLVGGYFLGKKKQRQKDESARDAMKNDAFKQLDELQKVAARGMDPEEARTQAQAIVDAYYQQIAQIKTKSVRQSAENFRPFFNAKIQNIVNAAQKGQSEAEFAARFSPTYSIGGRIPGVYDGSDSLVARLTPGETVLTPTHVARLGGAPAMARAQVPGYGPTPSNTNGAYANGGVAATPGEPPVFILAIGPDQVKELARQFPGATIVDLATQEVNAGRAGRLVGGITNQQRKNSY